MEDIITPKELWSIDRIEDGVAVLEDSGKNHMEIPARELPSGAREGDMLIRTPGGFALDRDEAAKRRRANAALFESLVAGNNNKGDNMISFEDVKNNAEINTYIQKADEALLELGFTEHSVAHVTKCAIQAGEILERLGHGGREAELARIAAYMHDIGNVVNRSRHAETGAMMVFRILERPGMDPAETATVISAIGNHDESTGAPVNAVAAALILADKCDVRRSRVRNHDFASFDIHDRVNYAVETSALEFEPDGERITLRLTIDNSISAVMDYFEIFLQRMLLCRRAANFLGLKFGLEINGVNLL